MHTRLVYVDGAYCYMLQCYNVTKMSLFAFVNLLFILGKCREQRGRTRRLVFLTQKDGFVNRFLHCTRGDFWR